MGFQYEVWTAPSEDYQDCYMIDGVEVSVSEFMDYLDILLSEVKNGV